MPLTEPQKKIFSSDARFRVVVAGRRFSKTYLSMWEIAKFARYPNRKIFYIAPTYRQAKQIIWEDLKKELTTKRWAKKINESDLTIELVNNSKIYLRSADNPDALRGVSMDFLVMDEAAMIDQRMWQEVCRPALSDRGGHGLFITTPRGMNWVYDLFQDVGHLPDYESFQYTTLDGGQVPEGEVEAAKRELDSKSFRQEYLATFETYSGLIYYNWNPKVNVTNTPPEITERTLLHIGMDFNVTPLVAAISVINDGVITFFDEIRMDGSNTYEMTEEIRNRYPNNRIWCYPDASGNARKTSSHTSDHKILQHAGFVIKSKGVNPAVRDRIASVNSNLLSMTNETRLYVTPNCKNIIKCISSQTYKEGTLIPDKTNDTDHMNDAVGYLTHWVNPIRAPIKEDFGPKRFGHF